MAVLKNKIERNVQLKVCMVEQCVPQKILAPCAFNTENILRASIHAFIYTACRSKGKNKLEKVTPKRETRVKVKTA